LRDRYHGNSQTSAGTPVGEDTLGGEKCRLASWPPVQQSLEDAEVEAEGVG